MRFVIQPGFVNHEEAEFIRSFERPPAIEIKNEHIKYVNDAVNGWTALHDFSKSELSKEVAMFQGDTTLIPDVSPFYEKLGHKIAEFIGISAEHMFFQYIVVGPGGIVRKHYDAGKPGYITYKCNICIDGPEQDVIYVDKESLPITPLSLYCFEANLYKHWMDKSDTPRIHLSYGFIVPLSDLGWDADSPRIRLSDRIWRAYIR